VCTCSDVDRQVFHHIFALTAQGNNRLNKVEVCSWLTRKTKRYGTFLLPVVRTFESPRVYARLHRPRGS
jgi:hypothetical protein